jgi:hypothetical protein
MKGEILFFSKENFILSLKKCNILGKKSSEAQAKWFENTLSLPGVEEIVAGIMDKKDVFSAHREWAAT